MLEKSKEVMSNDLMSKDYEGFNKPKEIVNQHNYPQLSSNEESKVWLSELGHGHGIHSVMAKRRSSFRGNGGSHSNSLGNESNCLGSDREGDCSQLSFSRSSENTITSSSPSGPFKSVWEKTLGDRSVVDLTRLYSGESGEVLRVPFNGMSRSYTNTSIAMSPAILIMPERSLSTNTTDDIDLHRHLRDQDDANRRLAGSYRGQ
jgi:hypothetical protein